MKTKDFGRFLLCLLLFPLGAKADVYKTINVAPGSSNVCGNTYTGFIRGPGENISFRYISATIVGQADTIVGVFQPSHNSLPVRWADIRGYVGYNLTLGALLDVPWVNPINYLVQGSDSQDSFQHPFHFSYIPGFGYSPASQSIMSWNIFGFRQNDISTEYGNDVLFPTRLKWTVTTNCAAFCSNPSPWGASCSGGSTYNVRNVSIQLRFSDLP